MRLGSVARNRVLLSALDWQAHVVWPAMQGQYTPSPQERNYGIAIWMRFLCRSRDGDILSPVARKRIILVRLPLRDKREEFHGRPVLLDITSSKLPDPQYCECKQYSKSCQPTRVTPIHAALFITTRTSVARFSSAGASCTYGSTSIANHSVASSINRSDANAGAAM